MDIIELSREIGRQLQQDERYLAMHKASEACDGDLELQNLIGEFNLKRMAINNESNQETPDEAKLQELNNDLRLIYTQVMQNENMQNYNAAKQELDALLNRVSAIISQCADGADPDTADYEESSCGGDCGSCGGCH